VLKKPQYQDQFKQYLCQMSGAKATYSVHGSPIGLESSRIYPTFMF